jgi:hypothetical protein
MILNKAIEISRVNKGNREIYKEIKTNISANAIYPLVKPIQKQKMGQNEKQLIFPWPSRHFSIGFWTGPFGGRLGNKLS